MRGRPKKTEGERRDNILRVRLTEDERRLLDQFAQEKALDTSSWARAALVALAKKSATQR
jgi:hypothetical protein